MDHPQLVEELVRRVGARIGESEPAPGPAAVIEGKVVSVGKVKKAFEAGQHTIRIPPGCIVTAEAQDFITDNRMTVL